MLARESGQKNDVRAVEFVQIGRFTYCAANVQQIGGRAVYQFVGAYVVIGKLKQTGGEPIVARFGNAPEVSQFYQGVRQALRGASIQPCGAADVRQCRSEEHTSELQSLMRI